MVKWISLNKFPSIEIFIAINKVIYQFNPTNIVNFDVYCCRVFSTTFVNKCKYNKEISLKLNKKLVQDIFINNLFIKSSPYYMNELQYTKNNRYRKN